ncbi:hypothetical protein [Actinomadura formosensis]|uniref:hypothetical protein n=1 Tax=Actinomadura formosensis TaxID=60706 RepID=UPI000834A06D|nr:hypothetical protein [Actinomadura formosensis]
MNETRATARPVAGTRPRNPFPKVPEVRLGGTGVTVQVETGAVRAVRRLALDFLTSRADDGGDPGNSGRVAAILGEYGTGKSHLAWTLMDELVRIAGTRPVVLVASGQPRDTVLSIHRRLLAPPGSGADGRIRPLDTAAGVLLFGTVERMVEDVYAGLRHAAGAEPDVPPPAASDELPVDEMWRLHERLTEIAEGDEELATVVSLVWHRTAGTAAWQWLRGAASRSAEDARLLADRGVHSPPVDSDGRALRVLRALARLCGWNGGRMVLVLDELHQIGSRGGDGPAEVAATLMELVGWAGETGALLAVCGLLDFWEALPQSVHERVKTRIVPSGLTDPQIKEYIRAALHPDGAGGADLYPFGPEAVEELWRITEGHPRRTLTLCHHAYELTSGTRLIGPRQVREASRSLCAPDNPDHVRGKLAGLCVELGYHVRRFPQSSRSRWEPDLRVGSRRGDGECAVVVSGPVLEDEELTELRTRASALMGNSRAHPRNVVLVMAGPLAATFTGDAEESFTRVLHWDGDTFRDDLAATLRSCIAAGEEEALYELVAEMRRELRELRELGTLPSAAAAAPEPAVWTDPDRRRRFQRADLLCRRALEGIAAADATTRRFWRDRFQVEGKGVALPRAAASGERYVALGDIGSLSVLKALGALALLEGAVGEFAARVRDLLADEGRTMRDLRGELKVLHRGFDHTLRDVINMFPDEYQDERDLVMRVLGVNRSLLNQYLGGLGATVYSAVVAPDPEDGT